MTATSSATRCPECGRGGRVQLLAVDHDVWGCCRGCRVTWLAGSLSPDDDRPTPEQSVENATTLADFRPVGIAADMAPKHNPFRELRRGDDE